MSFEDKQTTCSDCWITARNAERKRIIKLIETDIEQCEVSQQGKICQICDGKREAIELLEVNK